MENKEPVQAAEAEKQPEQKTDVKSLPLEQRLYVDSVWVLSVLFLVVCLWIIFIVIWGSTVISDTLTPDQLTTVMEVVAVIALLHLLKKTSIRFKDMGLSMQRFKQSMKRNLYRIPIQLAVFMLAKWIILKIRPDIVLGGKNWSEVPFWDWGQADMRLVTYLFTSFLQELLARGGVQEALTRVLPGKHADIAAIFMTSVFFMALHVQKGMFFMIGAGVLSFVLGLVYRKDRSIGGVWLIHYFFGKFADFLEFI